MTRFLFVILTVLLLSSCATEIYISMDLSPAEIIQKAQEALDKNRYNSAIQYYEALYERNRMNIDLVITAEYHIAFIHYKQGRYEQARSDFNSLLEYYNMPDAELFPQHFKRLSLIVLEQIDEKERQRRPFSRKTQNNLE